MPLDTVESFIKKHGHLPNIPSAEEVGEEGIKVSEMNAKLLEKVEELTLYVLALKKENDKLIKGYVTLKEENTSLKTYQEKYSELEERQEKLEQLLMDNIVGKTPKIK